MKAKDQRQLRFEFERQHQEMFDRLMQESKRRLAAMVLHLGAQVDRLTKEKDHA